MIARYPTKSQRNQEILRLHGEGKSVVEISASTGVPRSTIRDFLREHQIAPNPAPPREPHREDERNAMVVADMKNRTTQNVTVDEIARRHGISRQRVYAIVSAAKARE